MVQPYSKAVINLFIINFRIIWDPKDDLQLLRFIIKKGKKWNQFLKNNQNLQLKSIIKKRY